MPQLSLDLGLETERSVSVFSIQVCTVVLAEAGYTAAENGGEGGEGGRRGIGRGGQCSEKEKWRGS